MGAAGREASAGGGYTCPVSLPPTIKNEDGEAVKLLVAGLANLGVDDREVSLLREPEGHFIAEGVSIRGLSGREDFDAVVPDGQLLERRLRAR